MQPRAAVVGPPRHPGRLLQVHSSTEATALLANPEQLGASEALLDTRLVRETPNAQQATFMVFTWAQQLAKVAPQLRRVTLVYRQELGPAAQAAIAAWKSVAREWPDITGHPLTFRAVQLPHAADLPRAEDLFWCDGPVELQLTPQGVTSLELDQAPDLAAPAQSLGGVWVLTGGTRGVVGEVARRLIELGARKLLLVGRTAPAATSADLPLPEARRQARAQLGAGASASDVTAAAERLRKERQVARTVEQLRQLGAEVEVIAGDVAQPPTLQEAQAAVQRMGAPVTGVIWGAGIDHSRALLSKTEEEVRRVLTPKLAATPWFSAFPEAFAVAIGSVSGRFGNAGQIDYAAANAALVAEAVQRGGLALDYTAWADIGMAASLARAMGERGVDALPADTTAALSAKLIAARITGEVVVSGRLRGVENAPLADEIIFEIPGQEIRWRAELTLNRAFLADHRPTSAGVLPAVVALGAMEAAARRLLPVPWRVESFEIASGLKVFEGRSNVAEVHAVRQDNRVEAQVCSPQGVHHRAIFLADPGHANELPVASSPDTSLRQGPAPEQLYRTFFHGPSFQVVESTQLGPQSARATSRPLTDPLARDLPAEHRSTVAARELLLQAAGVFLTEELRTLALPVGAGSIRVRRAPRAQEVVEARVRFRSQQDDLFLFDAELVGQDATCIERWDQVAFKRLGQLG